MASSSSEYFDSYNDLSVHALMLKDEPRTIAYRDALEALHKAGKLRDAVVMDVGTGTGILALFAARFGCKHVYAVEASPMAVVARELVEANGLSDKITVLQARAEDVVLPEKVDIIVSEWMGFYLLHESMLGSVFVARDKWLKPGGIMLPTTAEIFVAPVEMDAFLKSRLDMWNDVYGFDYSPVRQRIIDGLTRQPEVNSDLSLNQLLAAPQSFAQIDCRTARPEELETLSGSHSFIPLRGGNLHALAMWFHCVFDVPTRNGDGEGVVLSTAPGAPPTHWHQTAFFLPEHRKLRAGVGGVDCGISMKLLSKDERAYTVQIEMHASAHEAMDEDSDEDEAGSEGMSAREALILALLGGAIGGNVGEEEEEESEEPC